MEQFKDGLREGRIDIAEIPKLTNLRREEIRRGVRSAFSECDSYKDLLWKMDRALAALPVPDPEDADGLEKYNFVRGVIVDALADRLVVLELEPLLSHADRRERDRNHTKLFHIITALQKYFDSDIPIALFSMHAKYRELYSKILRDRFKKSLSKILSSRDSYRPVESKENQFYPTFDDLYIVGKLGIMFRLLLVELDGIRRSRLGRESLEDHITRLALEITSETFEVLWSLSLSSDDTSKLVTYMNTIDYIADDDLVRDLIPEQRKKMKDAVNSLVSTLLRNTESSISRFNGSLRESIIKSFESSADSEDAEEVSRT